MIFPFLMTVQTFLSSIRFALSVILRFEVILQKKSLKRLRQQSRLREIRYSLPYIARPSHSLLQQIITGLLQLPGPLTLIGVQNVFVRPLQITSHIPQYQWQGFVGYLVPEAVVFDFSEKSIAAPAKHPSDQPRALHPLLV